MWGAGIPFRPPPPAFMAENPVSNAVSTNANRADALGKQTRLGVTDLYVEESGYLIG